MHVDQVLARQIEILRSAHPDWPEDRLMRVARVWARRARRMAWGGVCEVQDAMSSA